MRSAVIALLLFLLPQPGRADEQAGPAALPDLPSASLTAGQQGDAAVLTIDGIITPELARRFDAAMAALPPGQPLLLDLSSPGGYTEAGYAMIDRLLAERTAGRQVATFVRGGHACESMCVGLYMAGQTRYAAPDATFMVHAPRGLNSGTVTVKSTGRMIARLLDLGASAAWIDRVKQDGGFSGRKDFRGTAAMLVADGSNVVTVLLP
ncbi:ATP-dependent Clp protease proteolytic subunit [Oleisolibacter albus]|uniref:ATP-dependent Clp protease proteolytic subunit n=1 Tax=Oleisolibacter albus TaxID=2171757 RepID=UPI000DF3D157|nr:ATP-dependent Clp protease proteolytic subunit [Oleisolibacter albus]